MASYLLRWGKKQMELVLNQKGVSLAREAGAFVVKYADGRNKLSPDKVKSIVITGAATISSGAILLAVEHDIDILLLDRTGQPQARLWSYRFGSIASIRRQQIQFADSESGATWVVRLIVNRLLGARAILQALHKDRPAQHYLAETANRLEQATDRIRLIPQGVLDDERKARIRGIEGAATLAYFEALSRVVPDTFTFDKRSRRPARDMFNCALNYLYGMLYGKIELAMIRAGLDPYIGVFHRDDYNRPVMVYDLIEPYRCWAEAVLLPLCFRRAISADMFSESKGGLWLETEGKRVIIAAMSDYLQTVVQYRGKRRTRLVHLQEDCQSLAQDILAGEVPGERTDSLKYDG